MINFSALSNTSLVGRAARLPLALIPKRTVVPVVAGPLRGKRWKVGASDHGCWLGSYELDKQHALARRVKPGMVVYDVGANAGFYTLLFAQLVGPGGKVIAIEPFAENLVNLIDHVMLNRVANCAVVQAALAGERGIASFAPGFYNRMGKLARTETMIRVPTVSLDALVDEHGYPPPDLVKMDIEGGEGDALRGAAKLLARRRTTWFVALHGNEQKRRCQELLEAAGYALRTLAGEPIRGPLEATPIDEIEAEPAGGTAR